MTTAQALALAVIALAGWVALLHEARASERKERRMYRRDAGHNRQVAHAQQMRADRLAKDLIVAHIELVAAQNYAADMAAQRDDALRRLAAATWPIGSVHDA